MNIALWVVAGLFGLAYIVGGILKITMPHQRYAAKNLWAQDFSPGNLKSMGVIEIFGGIGLVLPGLLDVAPGLVPVAASAMALYMAGAVTERVRRGEWPHLLGDLVFLSAMLFVAWGRFGPEAWV